MKTRKSWAAAMLLFGCASIVPQMADADPKEVRREMREGQREVNRERVEARHEIRRERDDRYLRTWPGHYRDARYYVDGRRHPSNDYRRSDAHYHPGGKFCRDARHIAHLHDAYYRDDGRWYRDGRYWNEPAYVNRYYGSRNRQDDDNDDLVRGIVIGAAVVGVIAAIHEANDGD